VGVWAGDHWSGAALGRLADSGMAAAGTSDAGSARHRAQSCPTIEAGEGEEGLTSGVRATVPVSRVKPESKIV
jgi:hypothetical protein